MVKKKYLNDEDQRVWDEYTQGVKAIHPEQKPPEQHRKSSTTVRVESPSHSFTQAKPPSARDLKNVNIHARLDLHGMTQEQAYYSILRFIDQSVRDQKRCVLIITGKGQTETDHWWQELGILKAQVPRWLDEEPLKSKITTFTNARPEHGGTGALYVFLRRK